MPGPLHILTIFHSPPEPLVHFPSYHQMPTSLLKWASIQLFRFLALVSMRPQLTRIFSELIILLLIH